MLEIYEHNKSDCIKLLNMIICEIPFIKSFSDDCLLERLLSLISMITNAFDYQNYQSLDTNVFETEEERETSIREWLLRHYNAKCWIDELNFKDSEDRTRITVLIINILFKLRHSLKDIEQYLKDCESFVNFDRQLNHITRFDKLLEIVENDSNRWKSEARYFKVKFDSSQKLIEKYQQNEIFNYNSNPRNQNLYKSRISLNEDSEQTISEIISAKQQTNTENSGLIQQSSQSIIGCPKQVINGFDSQDVNNIHNNYLCVDCDQNYDTKYEYNLHVLKVHKNIDISHIIHNSKDCDFNNMTTLLDQSFDEKSKKCKNAKKRVFRCKFNSCQKSFHKTSDLKMHFVKHEPKIDKLLCVYNHYTNAFLNGLRGPALKAIHLSSNNNHKPKKNKIITNNNNIKTNIKCEYNIEINNSYELTNGCHLNNLSMQPLQPLEPVPFCRTDALDLSKQTNDSIQIKSDSIVNTNQMLGHS